MSNSFILALLRRLRKLNSTVVEDEVRVLLKRAQQKNSEQSRDTEFATHVCVIEEELEREKLKQLLETVRSTEFQELVRSERFFAVGKDADGRILANSENMRLFNGIPPLDAVLSPVERPAKRAKHQHNPLEYLESFVFNNFDFKTQQGVADPGEAVAVLRNNIDLK